MKLLTVTVPCYNSQDYMEKCIQSLLIGGERIEIIIIDDGSKDRTGEIADAYGRPHDHHAALVAQDLRVDPSGRVGHAEGLDALRDRSVHLPLDVDEVDRLVRFPQFFECHFSPP